MPLRVGVIGVGYLGRHHARIYSELDNVKLVGVADSDIKRAEEIAVKHGCQAFTDHLDLIPDCDALSIVTPTITHYEIAMKCLKEGKDILIEKPITERVSEAEEIIGLAAKKDLIVQVGHLERYNPAIIAASDFIQAPRFIESERLSPFLGRGIDVDVTLDLMIHDIDIVLSIVGARPVDMRASGESVITDKIDIAKVWIEFENGCKALVSASRISSEKVRRLTVFQKESFVLIDYQSQEIKKHFKAESSIATETHKPENREPLKEELKDFCRSVEKRTRPKVSGSEAAEALAIVLKISDIIRAAQRNN